MTDVLVKRICIERVDPPSSCGTVDWLNREGEEFTALWTAEVLGWKLLIKFEVGDPPGWRELLEQHGNKEYLALRVRQHLNQQGTVLRPAQ